MEEVPEKLYRDELSAIFTATKPAARFAVLEQLGGLDAVLRRIRTDRHDGLTKEEEETGFLERKAEFGTNEHKERPMPSIFYLMYRAWKDPMVIILTVAAFVAIILGVAFPEDGNRALGWIDGFGIIAAVVIVCVVTGVQDWMQEREFRKLNKEDKKVFLDVVRGGEQKPILQHELMVGDVLRIGNGAQVPADGILVACDEILTNEGSMTGESESIKKSLAHDPFLLSSTLVENGSGTMVVLAVGPQSQWGLILAKIKEDVAETPLQEKLGVLAANIGYLGLLVAILVFCVLMVYWVMDIFLDGDGWSFSRLLHILEFFIIAITIIVVAIPEGLPLAVTIALSYSIRQMLKDKNLVRHLHGCETMGGATVICSDKTGTLTEGRMTVAKAWIAGSPFDNMEEPAVSDVVKRYLADGLCVNSDVTSYLQEDPKSDMPIYKGSATECALLLLVNSLGENYATLRDEMQQYKEKVIPFNSTRKRMSTVIKDRDGNFRMFTKGAAEIVLARSTHVMNSDGTTSPLTDTLRRELDEYILGLARQGYRTLSMAQRDFEVFDVGDDEDDLPEEGAPDETDLVDRNGNLEQKLTLLAVVGIEDKLRKEVPESVRIVKNAGVRVIMITGDKLETAIKIAKDCAVLDDEANAIEGPEFDKMPKEEKVELLRTLQVMARSSPLDKLNLVKILKTELFQLVAVTGDGTNDAQALKEAHVGLAMGSGTQVAKLAADIVIQDDSFESVVAAVKWGRSIFDNIRKFLQFQLCVNVAALCVAFIGAVTRAGTPLKAIQLLWVNLIMDSMGALALATERPTLELLDRPPINVSHPKTRLLSNRMWVNIMGQSLYQVGILCLLLFVAPWVIGGIPPKSEVHFTLIFNAFVFCQIFNEVNARKVNGELNIFSGLLTNWMFIAIIVITVLLQVAIVELGGIIFKTVHLNLFQWGLCILIGFISWPLGLALRILPIWPDKNYSGMPGGDNPKEPKEAAPEDVVHV